MLNAGFPSSDMNSQIVLQCIIIPIFETVLWGKAPLL